MRGVSGGFCFARAKLRFVCREVGGERGFRWKKEGRDWWGKDFLRKTGHRLTRLVLQVEEAVDSKLGGILLDNTTYLGPFRLPRVVTRLRVLIGVITCPAVPY